MRRQRRARGGSCCGPAHECGEPEGATRVGTLASARGRSTMRRLIDRDLDPDRYPRLAEYLGLLPEGLRSYPECTSRGTLVSSAVFGHELASFPDGLPAAVRQLIAAPPLPGAWVPAVLSDAVFHAITDAHYPSLEAVMRWTAERTLRTARSKMYRALTRMVGPNMVLRIVGTTHGMFQRGTDMHATRLAAGVMVRLEHPPYLHWGYNHMSNVALIHTLLQLSTTAEPKVEMTQSTPTFAEYSAQWGERGA